MPRSSVFSSCTFASLLLILLFCMVMPLGCSDYDDTENSITYSKLPPNYAQKPIYRFAVHPLHNPKRLFAEYKMLINFINENTDDFQIRLVASRDYASFEQRLFGGDFEFALPNPLQSVKSLNHGYKIIGKMGKDEDFKGIIITRKDTHFRSVADLQGLPISFPAPTALAATIMPMVYLNEHGLNLAGTPVHYVGSQESAIMNVYLGKTVAAGTWPLPWKKLIAKRPEIASVLHVQWETQHLINNALVVHKNVPEAHVEHMLSLLIKLNNTEEGQEILKTIQTQSFELASAEDYIKVNIFMERFARLFPKGAAGIWP